MEEIKFNKTNGLTSEHYPIIIYKPPMTDNMTIENNQDYKNDIKLLNENKLKIQQ